MGQQNAAIHRSILHETYSQLSIEQLGRYSGKIRHNDKCVKCRFFVVPGDGPTFLGMQDIEMLGIIRFICETIDNKIPGRSLTCKLGV